MTHQFARIRLSETNYQESVSWKYIRNPDTTALNKIYRDYCVYKKFASVMPIFDSQYTDLKSDVIGYYDNLDLVAFSIIILFDQLNALCYQFAWNYHNPKKRLGIATLQTECAIYKARNFDYLYVDQAHLYKHALDGFEILGPME
jgi:hypothetical protein